MRSQNIPGVTTPLLLLTPRRTSGRRIATARQRGSDAGGTRGRAWINGREVGGTDPRFAHLATGSD
jgi:hypothetical protein